MLVAPLEIGSHSIIGAGSVITQNVLKNNLAVTRAEQKQRPYPSQKNSKKG